MRPGVEVISRAQPLPRTAPTDVGAAFMIGKTEHGNGPQLVRSLTEYESVFGTRQGFQDTYDAADVFFREGGAKLTVSRTNVGVAVARRASKDDAEAAPALVDAGIQAALDKLTKDYGPGQVFVADPLSTDAATQTALLDHAAACNRIALLSPADGTAAALTAAATALRATANARHGALFAPTATVPGVAAATTRSVPYAAVEAGIIARNDVTLNPNVPAAGVNGQAVFALDVAQRYTDAEYQSLNDAGVDMARVIYDGVRTYGYRTLVDPVGADAQWLELNHARTNMDIVAQAEVIGENYVFGQLDGRLHLISQFGSELRAMLVPLYEAGALYGATADDAFDVNVGSAVNTEATIANGELHAVLQVRMSPFSEMVVIEIVKIATTQAIAA